MDFPRLTTVLLLSAMLWLLGLLLYRLVLHPLARYPGPKLAAGTGLYETYYNFWRNGKWAFRLKELHDEYGPIIRINPHELHIRDAEFIDAIYLRKTDKYAPWVNTMGLGGGDILTTVDCKTHRQRRIPLERFLSKSSIASRESVITQKTAKLCQNLRNAFEADKEFSLTLGAASLTMDIITELAFGKCSDFLESISDAESWILMLRSAVRTPLLLRAVPLLAPVIVGMPRCMAVWLTPRLSQLFAFEEVVKMQVTSVLRLPRKRSDGVQRTIADQILTSDLPDEEKSFERLVAESIILVSAGSETTARALVVIMFFMILQPKTLEAVRKELGDGTLTWKELEKLPYFTATIKEGLRLAGSLTARTPRVLKEPLQYRDFTIPIGTPVSQTPWMILSDPSIFEDPEAFVPERWLTADSATGRYNLDKRLDKYFVPFLRGPRSCPGLWLAWAELYKIVAAIVSQFDLELVETTRADIDIEHDFTVGFAHEKSMGVKVHVRRVLRSD